MADASARLGACPNATGRHLTRPASRVYAFLVTARERDVQKLKTPSRVHTRASDNDDDAVAKVVNEIVSAVAADGDAAVRRYSGRLDGWEPESFRLDDDEIAACIERVPAQVLDDIAFCQEQVRAFARAQRATMIDLEVETLPGVRLGHRHIPVASVGAYVPGGRYPMVASAHMSVVTARVAGVQRVAACTPPLAGRVPDATIAAMQLAGADEIYVLGGVQALAALALGTETIDPVDFLVGPGTCTSSRPSAACSARSASTSSRARRRFSSSPTRLQIR
jgi:histidinol dehydrogenase